MPVTHESSHVSNGSAERGGGTYTFASKPRAPKTKYRVFDNDQEQLPPYGNIMYDKRIRRGNTYAQRNLPATAQPDPIELQKAEEKRKRAAAQKQAQDTLRPKSVDAVEGREHIEVQTELYLEELTDRVEEYDAETQTDSFLDRPPSPLFVPAKTGKDVATQILEGDLFDFDVEVRPMLEVLVGKTLEQALKEVVEEEELSNLRKRQREFEELRNAELIETQRLEEQERRHCEEKERRTKQMLRIIRKEHETYKKVSARVYALSYLEELVPAVFGTLHNAGYFMDPVERDIENNFLPSLMDDVGQELMKSRISREILDAMIREITLQRNKIYAKLNEDHALRIRDKLEAYKATPNNTTVNNSDRKSDEKMTGIEMIEEEPEPAQE